MNKIVDVVSLAFVVGAIMVLVRPGSQGPSLVNSISSGVVGLATAVTGSGTPPGWTQINWR